MSLRLDWCSHDAAKYAVEQWHYSRNIPKQKLARVGVWESGEFRGVVLFGDGANAGMFKPYGLDYTEGCELVRVALRSHQAPVSRIVAIALRLLKAHYPKLRLVVSFADPEQGHVGGIYQAGNWIYAGMTEAADEYVVHGVRMHGRALRATLKSYPRVGNTLERARRHLDPRTRVVKGSTKHRYLMPLDAPLRVAVERLAQPYPKRDRSRENAAAPPRAEGGVIPTRSLHL